MERKIMKMGPSSLVVSLPSEFIKKYNIKKGDEISMMKAGDSLVLKTDKEASLGGCSIDISDFNPIIMRVLGVLYKAGYDEISVTYDPEEKAFNNEKYRELDLIQKCTDLYSGMGLASLKKEKAVLKETSKIDPSEFDNVLSHAFFNLHQLSEEIAGSVMRNDFSTSKEVELMEKLLNQNTNFCLRMISKKAYSDFPKIPDLHLIIVNLEQIGDLFISLYRKAAKADIRAGLIEVVEELSALVSSFQRLHQRFDRAELVGFAKRSLKLNSRIIDLAEKNGRRGEAEMNLILFSINTKLYDLIEPLIALNHEKIAE